METDIILDFLTNIIMKLLTLLALFYILHSPSMIIYSLLFTSIITFGYCILKISFNYYEEQEKKSFLKKKDVLNTKRKTDKKFHHFKRKSFPLTKRKKIINLSDKNVEIEKKDNDFSIILPEIEEIKL